MFPLKELSCFDRQKKIYLKLKRIPEAPKLSHSIKPSHYQNSLALKMGKIKYSFPMVETHPHFFPLITLDENTYVQDMQFISKA